MTTAREQAREAARKKIPSEPGFYDVRSKNAISGKECDKIADAASDVWEPLVRQCFMLLDTVAPSRDDFVYEVRRIHKLLKEALGD